MKRHFWFMFFIILELVYVGGLIFGYDTLWLLLAANAAILLLLIIEPYWKIGASLIYLMAAEVLLHAINEKIFRLFLLPSQILTLLILLFGLIVVIVAYNKRPPIGYHEYRPRPKPKPRGIEPKDEAPKEVDKKEKMKKEEQPEPAKEEPYEDSFEFEDEIEYEKGHKEVESESIEDDVTQEIEETDEAEPAKSEKKLPEPKSFIATGDTVHTYDCWLAAKAKESRIVTEVYAKAQKMKECKRCKPYSNS